MRIILTGDLGFSADAEEVFGELDTKLLLATVLLVLVLLGAIYRAVLVALIAADRRLLRLHRRPGLHLPARQVGRDRLLERDLDPDRAHVRGGDRLLPAARLAIPRGAAPDRGQARGDGARGSPAGPGDPRQRADRRRWRCSSSRSPTRATPRRSGRSPRSASPPAMVAGLTLLPALLTIFGRARLLAAPRSSVAYDPGARGRCARQGSGGASATASCSARRPALAVTVSSSSPARSACSPTRSTTRRRRSSRSRSTASRASSCSSSRSRPGLLAPTTLLVQSEDGAGDRGPDRRPPSRRVEGVDGVASATPTGRTSEDGDDRPSTSCSRTTPTRRPRSTWSPTSARAVADLGDGTSRARRRRHGDPVRLRRGDRAAT